MASSSTCISYSEQRATAEAITSALVARTGQNMAPRPSVLTEGLQSLRQI
jgi:hypothetical protein